MVMMKFLFMFAVIALLLNFKKPNCLPELDMSSFRYMARLRRAFLLHELLHFDNPGILSLLICQLRVHPFPQIELYLRNYLTRLFD